LLANNKPEEGFPDLQEADTQEVLTLMLLS